MCSTCGYFTGHAFSCPENSETIITHCSLCGEPIYEGDLLINIGGKHFCGCVYDCDRDSLIEKLGGVVTKARA